MNKKISLAFYWPLFLISSAAIANQCDCQRVIGTCTGAIEFIKSYGSKPSFGAEIVVHSNVKNCSKVEYNVNNTPKQTILANTTSEGESLFGTSPITPSNVQYTACYVCSSTEETDKKNQQPQITQNKFVGNWQGTSTSSLGFSKGVTINISQTPDKMLNVKIQFDDGHTYSDHIKENDRQLIFSPSGSCNYTLTYLSESSISYHCSWAIFTANGTLQRQN